MPKNAKIENNYWKRHGKKLYECIDKVFGAGTKDAELAKQELAKGLGFIDFSYNSKQLGAMGALHKKSRTWLFSLRALRISVASALKMGH